MTDFEATLDALRDRVGTLVEDALSISVQYPNAPFVPPDDTAYIRMTVAPGVSLQQEYGSTKSFDNPGVMVLELLYPIENGQEAALQTADSIVSNFRAVTAAGVTYETPRVEIQEREDNFSRWKVNVVIPYYTEEVVSS